MEIDKVARSSARA